MKMAVLLKGNGSRGHFLFENPSLINFQIGNERKREFRAAEIRFYLHKLFARPRSGFYLHKLSVGAILKKATDDMALFVATPIFNFDRLAVGFAIGCRTGKNFPLRGLNGQEIL